MQDGCARGAGCAINDCLGRNAGFPIRAITNFIVARYSRGICGSRDASENLGIYIEYAKTTRARRSQSAVKEG